MISAAPKTRAALLSALAAIMLAGVQQPTALAQTVLLDTAPCPAERAIYELRVPDSDEVWRLGLVPARTVATIASDLYLRLTTPQRDYWFTFSVAQGYGGISIFPVSDPYVEPGPHDLLAPPYGDNPAGATAEAVAGWLRFIVFDADLNVMADPPMRGDVAPHAILLPEIGLGLWYETAAFTDDPKADRDPMPVGIFRRTSCLVVPPPPAWP